MDRQGKLEYQQKVEKYLNDNRVYDLFEDLLKSIVAKQPDNPIAYMIEKLGEAPSTSPLMQPKRSSLWGRRGSRCGSWLCRWPTTTSSRRCRWATSYARKFQKSCVIIG